MTEKTNIQTIKGIPTLGYNEDGIMGSTITEDAVERINTNTETVILNKIAVFSTRNLYTENFGKLKVGYNIISNTHSDFWLSQRGVRLATPQEVAEAFA